jgi:hypothetical protein
MDIVWTYELSSYIAVWEAGVDRTSFIKEPYCQALGASQGLGEKCTCSGSCNYMERDYIMALLLLYYEVNDKKGDSKGIKEDSI